MNTYTMTNHEQLIILKNAYFDALQDLNETYTEAALDKLRAAEDAYMSFTEDNDVRISF